MPRILPVNTNTTNSITAELFGEVQKKMGVVPNIVATMANSPAVAKAYLGFSQALSTGTLSPQLREQISLAVGEANNCNYCLAAHTALGKGVGLSDEKILNSRRATSDSQKEHVALDFAKKIVLNRGNVADTDVDQLRLAGYTDGEIGEIVANVALNIFTNYFNHIAGTELDFPAAPSLKVA